MEKITVQVQATQDTRKTTSTPDSKALKILAKSIFRQLREQGYEPTAIVTFATEIISLVTSDLAQSDTKL